MRLADLEPEWVSDYNPADRSHYRGVELTLQTAQGIMFLCPVCFLKNAGPIGTHSVLVWFSGRGVPDDAVPGEARAEDHPKGMRTAQRWSAEGMGFGDLTLKPSVDLQDHGNLPHEWHGFVNGGEIKIL